mgnify:CR=1 FL=1
MNILFPVNLNDATCNITDIVSSTGINAIISKISGILKYSARPDITPPKKSEPVSPINTFAGYILNIKNASIAPTTIEPNIVISFTVNIVAITVKAVIIIAIIYII